jgi:hypothetical protein
MHTVDLLEQALSLAATLGIRVRQEWLGGSGGGCCEIRGQRWLFVDLALAPAEQFAQVASALEIELKKPTEHPATSARPDEASDGPRILSIPISSELHRALELRKSA